MSDKKYGSNSRKKSSYRHTDIKSGDHRKKSSSRQSPSLSLSSLPSLFATSEPDPVCAYQETPASTVRRSYPSSSSSTSSTVFESSPLSTIQNPDMVCKSISSSDGTSNSRCIRTGSESSIESDSSSRLSFDAQDPTSLPPFMDLNSIFDFLQDTFDRLPNSEVFNQE